MHRPGYRSPDLAKRQDFIDHVQAGTPRSKLLQIYGEHYTGGVIKHAMSIVRGKYSNPKTAADDKLVDSAAPATTAAPAPAATESKLSESLLKLLAKKRGMPVRLLELCEALDASPGNVRNALQQLQGEAYAIEEEGGAVKLQQTPQPGDSVLNIAPWIDEAAGGSARIIRFGACGDNHSGSKYTRLDALNAFYDILEQEGILTVFHTGNYLEGESRFNVNDISIHGVENQVAEFVRTYPQRQHITTHFVAGDDHEGWYTQRTGLDTGRKVMMDAIDAGRHDLRYLGYGEANIRIPAQEPDKETVVRVQHPGGGSAYAISYSPQKLIESFSGGEKPNVLLIGHYHKSEYIYYRNIHCVQTGCFQDQSMFMRKKRLSAHLGGWIIEMHQGPSGEIKRFKCEFINFYDRKFYAVNWHYKMSDDKTQAERYSEIDEGTVLRSVDI